MKQARLRRKASLPASAGVDLVLNQDSQFLAGQRFKRNFLAVKKDCRRAFHAQRMTTLAVEKDSLRDFIAAHVALVALDIESDLVCVAFKNWTYVKLVFPVLLMFVNQIVHFPKPALQTGSFCR